MSFFESVGKFEFYKKLFGIGLFILVLILILGAKTIEGYFPFQKKVKNDN